MAVSTALALRRVLRLIEDTRRRSGGEQFPGDELHDALRELVPCDFLIYNELDLDARRVILHTERPDSGDVAAEDAEAEEEDFWRLVDQNPLCGRRAYARGLDTVKLSDFVSRRTLHALEVYATLFRPWGIEHTMKLTLSSDPSHMKAFLFHRQAGARDFAERDRLVLDLLRPHLGELRGRSSSRCSGLTRREHEILAGVASGWTNAEIARTLFVTPNTIRKHLENIYAKLDVHTRTAALAKVSPALPPASGRVLLGERPAA